MNKLPPCCARFQTALVREEGELRRVSRMANNRMGRGLSTVREQARIAEIKTAIARIKTSIDDHEAEHAGD
jgi:ribosomal protein L29